MADIPLSLQTVRSGVIRGGQTAEQLPSVPCALVKFKALIGNSGNVYLCSSSSATLPTDQTTDTTSGLELAPGDDSGWIPVENLNKFFKITENNGDDLSYVALL